MSSTGWSLGKVSTTTISDFCPDRGLSVEQSCRRIFAWDELRKNLQDGASPSNSSIKFSAKRWGAKPQTNIHASSGTLMRFRAGQVF